MAKLDQISQNKVPTGTLTKYAFPSTSLGNLKTNINVFLPDSASTNKPVSVLFYLAGLTCTEDTGAQKGGFLNTAGEEGLGVVFVDTSPRGAGVEGEEKDSDFGTGESEFPLCERGRSGCSSQRFYMLLGESAKRAGD